MRPHQASERRERPLVLPGMIPGVVVLCLCAAAVGQGDRVVRVDPLELRTLAGLVTRMAEAARPVRPGAVMPERSPVYQARLDETISLRPDDGCFLSPSPLREALLNLPPPDRA